MDVTLLPVLLCEECGPCLDAAARCDTRIALPCVESLPSVFPSPHRADVGAKSPICPKKVRQGGMRSSGTSHTQQHYLTNIQ